MHTIEWAAGLFEGEGCLNDSRRKYPALNLSMCDKDVVNNFAEVVGYGKVHKMERPSPRKTIYRWEVNKRSEVRRILDLLLPHLGLRRAYKALNILDDLELATN